MKLTASKSQVVNNWKDKLVERNENLKTDPKEQKKLLKQLVKLGLV